MSSSPHVARRLSFFAFVLTAIATLCISGCASDKESLTVPMDYRPTSRVHTARFAGSCPSGHVRLGMSVGSCKAMPRNKCVDSRVVSTSSWFGLTGP